MPTLSRCCPGHAVKLNFNERQFNTEFERIMKSIARAVHAGRDPKTDKDLQRQTASALWEAVTSAYGNTPDVVDYGSDDHRVLLQMRANTFVFSGFKTEQELRAVGDLLLDENGKRRPFSKFSEEVLKLNEAYNVNYLRSEYNLADASAKEAAKWTADWPLRDRYYGMYETVGDGRVREKHRKLEGTVQPLDSAFWRSYNPPLDWGCRCSRRLVPKDSHTPTNRNTAMARGEAALKSENGRLEMFRGNAGIDGVIFPEKHPYFAELKKAERATVARDTFDRLDKEIKNGYRTDIKKYVKAAYTEAGRTVFRKEIKGEVGLTMKGVKHLINTPHRFRLLKEHALLDFENIMKGAEFVRTDPDIKDNPRVRQYHYFRFFLGGEPSYLVVREMNDGSFLLYDIVDALK